jgi:hypothetical protein
MKLRYVQNYILLFLQGCFEKLMMPEPEGDWLASFPVTLQSDSAGVTVVVPEERRTPNPSRDPVSPTRDRESRETRARERAIKQEYYRRTHTSGVHRTLISPDLPENPPSSSVCRDVLTGCVFRVGPPYRCARRQNRRRNICYLY